jgi:medium-chain acyl-[acyl-carrier-protein] hydrolase
MGVSQLLSVYKNTVKVELRDVDFKKQLRLSQVFSYFQDIASEAVEELGVGINYLEQEYGVTWILIRMRVDIKRLPQWNETITIETWPQEPKSLEFERDFVIKDQLGNVLVQAVSTWIIMDINTRRIKRTSTINLHYPDIKIERAIDCELKKLPNLEESEVAYKKVIGYSDIDFNGHLNNSKYIDYALDCFPIENHRQYEVSSLEVNFLSEALPGQVLIMDKDVSQIAHNQIFIDAINEESQQILFKAKVSLVKN